MPIGPVVDFNEIRDLARNSQLFGNEATFKAGLSHTYKERDYEILQYQLQFFGAQPTWTGDPDAIFDEDNLKVFLYKTKFGIVI